MNKLSTAVKKILLAWGGSGLLLIIFLVATQPLSLSLPVLLVPFLLFAVWVRSGALLVGLAMRRAQRPSRKMRVIANSIAAVLLLVVTLQSLGQLSWRDMLLIIGLIIGLGFYLYKTDLL